MAARECIHFSDDMILLAESEQPMNAMLGDLNTACEEYEKRINTKKIKCMLINGQLLQANIKVGQKNLNW